MKPRGVASQSAFLTITLYCLFPRKKITYPGINQSTMATATKQLKQNKTKLKN